MACHTVRAHGDFAHDLTAYTAGIIDEDNFSVWIANFVDLFSGRVVLEACFYGNTMCFSARWNRFLTDLACIHSSFVFLGRSASTSPNNAAQYTRFRAFCAIRFNEYVGIIPVLKSVVASPPRPDQGKFFPGPQRLNVHQFGRRSQPDVASA